MRYLRGYLLASVVAAAAFTLALAGIERESNTGNILAGTTVFLPYALLFTAVLAPIGLYLVRRMRRNGFMDVGLMGAVLGWLSTMVLFRGPGGLIDPMALAFAVAGFAAGLGFRAGHGPVVREPDRAAGPKADSA